ncbi:hypothetical protein BJX66DRAFT_343726 [Aspergillus keveii]|uniref:FAD binding domain protein n=1 Tax=Aspergillus keveii TaxID=714993 RepID=A0ABR4FNA8_9EURO
MMCGISFFSGYHGFVCDNIINYQAVLATGDIVNVNRTSNSDLYWALRGGGNNFAIITRFDILTFTHDHMWGGIRTYNISHTPFLIEAYVDFGQNAPSDPGAYQITTLYNIRGKQFCTVDLYSVDPKPAPLLTHALDPIPHNDDTTAVQRQSKISWTNSVNQPDGYRQTYWTATFHLSRNFAHFIAAEFNEMTKLIQGIKGLQARCIMQILTADMLAHRRRNGGNALGLDYDEPLILLNPVLRWEDAADDAEIMRWSAEFVNRLTNEAKASDLHVPWLHTNYASELQDVLSGRRSDDLQRLRDISRKYDPEKVFQRLLPGGFKLGKMRVIEDGY